MKISEHITRECCDPIKDLVPYRGYPPEDMSTSIAGRLKFCKHCGQIWVQQHCTVNTLRKLVIARTFLKGECEQARSSGG